MVLKSTNDIERLLSDEELYLLEEELENEENEAEPSEAKSVPSDGELEPFGDAMDLYLLECRRTRLLTGDEEKTLGSSIEDGRFLSEIDQELETKNGYPPSEIELLLELIRRLGQSSSLLKAVSKHLELQPRGRLLETVLNPLLRKAIDGLINERFLRAMARANGTTEAQTMRSLVDLSLVSRLIPWNVIQGLSETSSVYKLKTGRWFTQIPG